MPENVVVTAAIVGMILNVAITCAIIFYTRRK